MKGVRTKIRRSVSLATLAGAALLTSTRATAQVAQRVQEQLDAIADVGIPYLEVLVGVGILTMALIEVAKKVLKARERYHSSRLWNWITKTVDDDTFDPDSDFAKENPAFAEPFNSRRAFAEIIYLAVGEPRKDEQNKPAVKFMFAEADAEDALYSLELERMCGQLQNAFEAILNSPDSYVDAYKFVTLGVKGDQKDRRNWIEYARESRSERADDTNGTSAAEEADEAKKRADTYSRLSERSQRKLDTFQLRTAYHWKRLNQLAAFIVGAGALSILLAIQYSEATDPLSIWTILAFAISGGIVAPLAKDLLFSLQKLRKPS